MELTEDILKVRRELSKLDEFVLSFTRKLDEVGVEYVIVSGYIAVLTGRSRGTEDIDVVIEKLNRKETEDFVEKILAAGYWCLNEDASRIYDRLEEGVAVRFAEEEKVIPNFELSFPTTEFEETALADSLKAKINSDKINISPLELQIAYKLYLGSEKDWEDALHLYRLFEGALDVGELEDYSKKLDVLGSLDELREA